MGDRSTTIAPVMAPAGPTPRTPSSLERRRFVAMDWKAHRPRQGGTRMLRPTALDHVGLKVSDMDRTLHFYHQVLGLELLRTSGPNADGGRSAVVKVGGQEINVFSRPDFVSVAGDNSVGVDHFCLVMDAASIDDVMADLRQA